MDNKPNRPALRRRDGTGHLDRQYAEELRALGRETAAPRDDDAAFLEAAASGEELSQQLGASFVKTATSGEDCAEDVANEVSIAESGGPFVESSGSREFAHGTDESNPEDAEREPFPKT